MKLSNLLMTLLILCAAAIFAAAQQPPARLKTVKVYLPKYDGSDNAGDLQPVKRLVDKDAPLRPTLEILFAPRITADEDRQGFGTATFGMKFEGVELKNGTAIVRFSQPPNEIDYGSTGIFTFDSAVEKTVRQFASVKRVKICAVGATQIDSELTEPYPRCSKLK